MQPPILLITGASGFTGGYCIAAAKRAGIRCIALCRDFSDTAPLADECLYADLVDNQKVQSAVAIARPQYVLHLAGIANVAHGSVSEMYQVNLVGTVNLLRALSAEAPDVKKILIASSANIYGNTSDLPIRESAAISPANHYGVSKYAMELAASLELQLPITIVRPFNYTGIGQTENFLIPKIISAFQNKQDHIELGNLDVARDFSDVRDVSSAYVKLLLSNCTDPVYNICSGTAYSLMEIIEMLNRIAGYEITVNKNPEFAREGEIKMLYGSPLSIESVIGSYREFTFQKTLEWMFFEN
jgi:GDP-6-deoxy-D-talose 4-dehydrogenase